MAWFFGSNFTGCYVLIVLYDCTACLVTDALAHYARVDRRTGRVCIDAQTGRCEWQTNVNDAVKNNQDRPPVWCGGDASIALGSGADSSQTTVESANDGKTAAYHIHEYLQVYNYLNYQLYHYT